MLKALRKYFVIITAIWATLLLPSYAIAQDGSLTCSSSGSVAGGTLLDTSASGGYCAFTGLKHAASTIVCRFIEIVDDVMSKVYCGLQQSLLPVLQAAFTLYIAIFGLQLGMGMTSLSLREGAIRLLKLGGIWLFAANAVWGVGMIFTFFLNLSSTGITWVMDGINTATGGGCSAGGVCPAPNPFCDDPSISNAQGFMIPLTKIDDALCNAVAGPLTEANTKVVGFFLALSAIIPPVFLLAVYLLWTNFWIVVQGVKTLLLGIASMAFLITLSPIFLSLMLFKATYQFFETWLRFLISFSLQIIIIFACVAMWIIITLSFVGFFNELSNMIQPMEGIATPSGWRDIVDSYGFCKDYSYSDTPDGPSITCNNAGDRLPVSALMISEGDENHTQFVYFIIYHLVTLLIVAFSFRALINQAPLIAVYLAGPEYVPLLGQGFGLGRTGQFRSFSGGEGVNARIKANAERSASESSSQRMSEQIRDTLVGGSRPSL